MTRLHAMAWQGKIFSKYFNALAWQTFLEIFLCHGKASNLENICHGMAWQDNFYYDGTASQKYFFHFIKKNHFLCADAYRFRTRSGDVGYDSFQRELQ
jgi:hypothetical protein